METSEICEECKEREIEKIKDIENPREEKKYRIIGTEYKENEIVVELEKSTVINERNKENKTNTRKLCPYCRFKRSLDIKKMEGKN